MISILFTDMLADDVEKLVQQIFRIRQVQYIFHKH